MQPMPDMNPEITGAGTNLPHRHQPTLVPQILPDKSTQLQGSHDNLDDTLFDKSLDVKRRGDVTARTTTVKAAAWSVANVENSDAATTVIGPVGPVTCAGVPPNSAARKPANIAPYNPANGPAPKANVAPVLHRPLRYLKRRQRQVQGVGQQWQL